MILKRQTKILQLPIDIQKDKKILDIGCGKKKFPGAIGLDHYGFENIDVIANLDSCIPFLSDTYDIVHASQVLEHIHDLTFLMEEVHRVLKKDGILIAHVPYFRSSWAHIDPTHVRSFTLNTLDYYVSNNWISDEYGLGNFKFSKIEKLLDVGYPATLLRKIFSKLALRQISKFENSFLSFIYPFQGVSFILYK